MWGPKAGRVFGLRAKRVFQLEPMRWVQVLRRARCRRSSGQDTPRCKLQRRPCPPNDFAFERRPLQIQEYALTRTPGKRQAYDCRERSEPRLPLANEVSEVRPSAATACSTAPPRPRYRVGGPTSGETDSVEPTHAALRTPSASVRRAQRSMVGLHDTWTTSNRPSSPPLKQFSAMFS